MAKLIILEDCIDALTKVWIENWRGTPTWSCHYRGPALQGYQTRMKRLCETYITEHVSGCGGAAWVISEFNDQNLYYHAQFDVACRPQDDIGDTELQAYGHSEFVAQVIFRVEGKGSTVHFGGNVYETPTIRSRMRLYDWTDGSTVLTKIGPPVPLIDNHIYRMTIHTRMSGYHDPTEIVNVLAFNDAQATISDQPILCPPVDLLKHKD